MGNALGLVRPPIFSMPPVLKAFLARGKAFNTEGTEKNTEKDNTYEALVLGNRMVVKPLKCKRGSHASPFQQNPYFTPSRTKPGVNHHPGKFKTTCPS